MNVNQTISRLTSNPIGTIVGAYAGYYVAKKLVNTQQMWMTVAIAIVGGVVGAGVQAKMGAKSGTPTAVTVNSAPAK